MMQLFSSRVKYFEDKHDAQTAILLSESVVSSNKPIEIRSGTTMFYDALIYTAA